MRWGTAARQRPRRFCPAVGRRHTTSLTGFAFILFGCVCAEAACVEQATLVHSVASIAREFSDDEKKAAPALLGVRGTAWFLNPKLLVTAGHVAEDMHLAQQIWKEIDIAVGENKYSVPARVLRMAGTHSEKIAIVELRTAFSGAEGLPIRLQPLIPGEQLVSLAFPSNRARFASGRFVQYGADDGLAGTALLEMYDGNDRLVLDHGASGAPILDCEGRVVAVVSNIFTKTMSFMSQAIRVSTAWGSANVVSLPVSLLEEATVKEAEHR
jgi:hypothetical protein